MFETNCPVLHEECLKIRTWMTEEFISHSVKTPLGIRSKIVQWLFPKNVNRGDLILPVITTGLLAAVGIFTFQIFQSQEHDADLIDLAGQQRMLVQTYYREALGSRASSENTQKTLGVLLDTARILRYGGFLKSPSDSTKWIQVEPLKNPEQQKIQEKHIHAIEQLAGDALRSRGQEGAEIDPVTLENILSLTNQIVRFYADEATAHTRKMVWVMVGLTSALGVLGLFLSRLMFERRIQMLKILLAKNDAVKASEAKTRFLANMSHEIRTPLNAIIGLSDILQGTTLTLEQARFVKTLRRAGDTLLSLINDILDLSKIESGQVELHERELDVMELVDRLTEMVALRAHQKGLEIMTFIAPDIPTHVIADDIRLRQILTNLLSNAVKFTSAGEISLRLEFAPDMKGDDDQLWLRFSVSDTGIGIPENKLETIFENFSQADQNISVEYGGTGLGLAICRRLVQLMKGTIQVRSKPGAGSTFIVCVPVRRSLHVTDEQEISRKISGKKILVVDDNDTNRLIVRNYLSEIMSDVDEAASGSAALNLLKKAQAEHEPYDLILLDYRMPGLSGTDVARKIKTDHLAAGTILMLLTSDGVRNDISQLQEIGISEYMVKPIRKREFLSSVAGILGARSGASLTPVLTPSFEPTPGVSETINGKGRRILVVDDVEDNRLVATSYLTGQGFDVDEADNGEDAIQLRMKQSYDLIFMDIRMTPMDGYETTKKIREWEIQNTKPRVPIIALSAQAMKEEIDQALMSGCDSYVGKPIRAEKLFEAVRKYVKCSPAEASAFDEAPHADAIIQPQLDDFLRARLPSYLSKLKTDLTDIDRSLREGDLMGIGRVGHNVSGTAGMYGLDELVSLARQLELSSEQGLHERVTQVRDQMLQSIDRIRV